MKKLFIASILLIRIMPAYTQDKTDADYDRGVSYYLSKKYEFAVAAFRVSANHGFAKAQSMLAICFLDGLGITPSPDSAFYWSLAAAKQGYAKAQNNVGSFFEKGTGTTQSYTDAAEWYKEAADQGNAMAQNNLGVLYNGGVGVALDYDKALQYYRLAIAQNYTKAKFNLGVATYKGEGISASVPDALKLFEQAANEGYVPAINLMGSYYVSNDDSNSGYKKAFKWYEISAKTGDKDGLYYIAQLYEYGLGTTQNITIARNIFKLAADKGRSGASEEYKRLDDILIAEAKAMPPPKPVKKKECLQIMCSSCFGSGQTHTATYGGSTTIDKYGHRSTSYGSYSMCFKCLGSGNVRKCF